MNIRGRDGGPIDQTAAVRRPTHDSCCKEKTTKKTTTTTAQHNTTQHKGLKLSPALSPGKETQRRGASAQNKQQKVCRSEDAKCPEPVGLPAGTSAGSQASCHACKANESGDEIFSRRESTLNTLPHAEEKHCKMNPLAVG